MTIRYAAAVSAVLLALTACTPESEPTEPTSPAPTTATTAPNPGPESSSPIPSEEPTPTPTEVESYPPPSADETDEQAAIREGWENYREVSEKYAKDPSLKDWTETQYVTTGFEAQNIIETISRLREANLKLVGDTVYTMVEVGEPETNAEGVTIAIVTSCLDPTASERAVVDIDTGEPADTQLTQSVLETVTMELGADNIWRAADYRNEGETC